MYIYISYIERAPILFIYRIFLSIRLCLWQALASQNLPSNYIHLLQKRYDDLTAVVKTDKQSRRFSIELGVNQGDPLSSLLFNALLEDIFPKLKIQWCRRSYGIQLGHTHTTRLTKLRLFRRRRPTICTNTSTTNNYADTLARPCPNVRARTTP